ncbi:MAG: cupredoxin domain-containing protein [Paludibacter sp.]|nr:cupredoxin domain-containing protein [Paludibacter sp.]
MKTKILFIAVLALILASCKNEIAQAPNEVILSGLSFSPKTLTVDSGTTVIWLNNEAITHTVTSDSALFESSNLGKGDKYSHTFNIGGTYAYHCKYHPNMTGNIIVTGGIKPNPNLVTIAGYAFSPSTLTVKVGTSVTWTNKDAAIHTATSTSATSAFDSGDLQLNKSFTFKFTTAGTYPYICIYHIDMKGTIIVIP